MRDVIGHMTEMVEETVKLYKGDFYNEEYGDLARISEHGLPYTFCWGVRNTGTNFLDGTLGEPEYYEVLKKNTSNEWYLVEIGADGSGAITKSEKRCDEFIARAKAERDSHRWRLVSDGEPVINEYDRYVVGTFVDVQHWWCQHSKWLSRNGKDVHMEVVA